MGTKLAGALVVVVLSASLVGPGARAEQHGIGYGPQTWGEPDHGGGQGQWVVLPLGGYPAAPHPAPPPAPAPPPGPVAYGSAPPSGYAYRAPPPVWRPLPPLRPPAYPAYPAYPVPYGY